MDGARQSGGKAVIATVLRQFAPSRIERQLLAQVFDLVAHAPPTRANGSDAGAEPQLSAASRDVAEASVAAEGVSRCRVGRAAA
jgi:hypothetical protein